GRLECVVARGLVGPEGGADVYRRAVDDVAQDMRAVPIGAAAGNRERLIATQIIECILPIGIGGVVLQGAAEIGTDRDPGSGRSATPLEGDGFAGRRIPGGDDAVAPAVA